MKVGDTVRFRAPTGSWGVVEAIDGDRIRVRWNYGLDKFGRAITALSDGVDRHDLVTIDRALFNAYVACGAWGDEQKAVEKRVRGTGEGER